MKNRIFRYVSISIACLCLSTKALIAQEENNLHAVIDVFVDNNISNDLSIHFEMNKEGINSFTSKNTETVKTALKSNITRIILPLKTNLNYGRINYTVAGSNKLFESSNNLFIFQYGDTVEIHLSKDRIRFAGKDADKYEFMCNNYRIAPFNLDIYHALAEKGRFKEAIRERKKLTDSVLNRKLTTLRKIKNTIDKEVRGLIYMDLLALHNSYFFGAFSSLSNFPKYRHLVFDMVGTEIEKYFPVGYSKQFDPNLVEQSYWFSYFLRRKEIFSIRINKSRKENSINGTETFQELLDVIRTSYEGPIRDKLILEMFQSMAYRKDNVKASILQALNLTGNLKYKEALQRFISRNFENENAFAFELTNTQGELVKLADFKGKLIVMDFWFTGCMGCMILTKQLTPIIEDYKENTNIVFVSVSVDKKRDVWLKNSEAGKYTPKEAIHLYTDEEATHHPLIKYYNIIGYPTLVLISKEGKTITTSPPRPNAADPQSAVEFKQLLNENLQ